jgi:hypothetical protein
VIRSGAVAMLEELITEMRKIRNSKMGSDTGISKEMV